MEQIKINFWGDFKSTSTSDLILSDDVKSLINSADANVINFEAPVLSNPSVAVPILKSGPAHYQSFDAVKWLESNGFNLISLANNHIMDYGESALFETHRAFTHAKVFGAGLWNDAYRPISIKKNGISVAILGLSHYEFGMLADRWDTKCRMGVAWINHPDVDTIILNAKKSNDYLIVFAHAGLEHVEQPLPEWRDRYRSFIDLGCDAVIASHPHIVQGWEFYKGKPIVYSLGNFYFPKAVGQNQYWYNSLCAVLTLNEGQVCLDVSPIVFNEKLIRLDSSSEIDTKLKIKNDILSNNSKYMEYVNNICINKAEAYDILFERSGYVNINKIHILLKSIIKRLLGHKSKSVHILNNIRCESHRWCISRGIKLINKK